MPKISKTYRLSDETIKELESLTKRYKISQTDVITILIHCNFMGWYDEDAIESYFELAKVL